MGVFHDGVVTWKRFSHNWLFSKGIKGSTDNQCGRFGVLFADRLDSLLNTQSSSVDLRPYDVPLTCHFKQSPNRYLNAIRYALVLMTGNHQMDKPLPTCRMKTQFTDAYMRHTVRKRYSLTKPISALFAADVIPLIRFTTRTSFIWTYVAAVHLLHSAFNTYANFIDLKPFVRKRVSLLM